MSVLVSSAPRLTTRRAEQVARDAYGLDARATALASDRDQNFLIAVDGVPRYVLKVSNPAESRPFLEAQARMTDHVARRAPEIVLPAVRASVNGEDIVTVEGRDAAVHLTRLVTYVPGTLLADHTPRTPALMHDLGGYLATLDHALLDFRHPALDREFEWDLTSAAATVRRHLPYVDAREDRRRLERYVDRFEDDVAPALGGLRASVIHNDANDHNVIVGETAGRAGVRGLIDLGDAVRTRTVFELAVAVAYAILDEADPLAWGGHVVAGYHERLPLEDRERALLFDLVCARLCISVAVSAQQKKLNPSNAYLTVSEAPAWAMLETLDAIPRDRAAATLTRAVRP